MDPFTVGWIMGGLTGTLFGVMATLTYQWWTDHRVRRVEWDDYTARLRALDRHPLNRDTDNRTPYEWIGNLESPRRIR